MYPNVDQKDPTTVVDMVNILTLPDAQRQLDDAMGLEEAEDSGKGLAEFALPPREYRERQRRVYRNADVDPMLSLLRRSRSETVHRRAPFTFGNVVLPGNIGLYSRHGIVYAVPEGRWMLFPDPIAKWMGGALRNVSLDQSCIRTNNDDLLIIRIIEGEVGLITVQGVHRILDVGTHVFNSGTVKFHGVQQLAVSNHFSHGPYHYINVPRGQYAKVWAEVVSSDGGIKSLVPRLLKEGEHFIKSPFFRFQGLADVAAEYIGHGSVHVVNVLKGHVAKIFHDNVPRLLGEGEHIVESPNFSYMGAIKIVDNPCIVHGTITVVQVPQGKIALVWSRNEPKFIDEPGIYEFNSDDFQFHEFVDCSERRIELGSKKVIQGTFVFGGGETSSPASRKAFLALEFDHLVLF